jgi:hypothetical protein
MIIDIHEILIFSKNLKEHEQHVCLVFNKLWEKCFEAKLKKSCFFHQSKLGFLSCIIFYNGLSTSSKKIQIVINWQMPFYFMTLNISWGLQISIEFLSKITQRLLHL